MNTKRDVLMVIVALAAGLVGGVVSSELLRGAPVFAQKAPQLEKVLQAKRFEVVDQAGKVRAELGMSPDGRPVLSLFDEAGKRRAALSMTPDGTLGLALSDQAEKTRAALGLAPDGSPGLALYDQAEKQRAALTLMPDGSPGLALYDEVKKMRAALGYTQLEAIGTGETVNRVVSSLVLFDKDGKVIWKAP